MQEEADTLQGLVDGYGDLLEEIAGDDWEKLAEKIANGTLTFEDFLGAGGYLGQDSRAL